jgi:hypothetical protein
MLTSSPVVIGATGGSGTTLLAKLIENCGYVIAIDHKVFVRFADKYVNDYYSRGRASDKMKTEFAKVVTYCRNVLAGGSTLWGWKEPRSLLLIRFIHEQLPEVKFIHLIRDGRDMAYSGNQNQLHRHGVVLLRDEFNPIQIKWAKITSHMTTNRVIWRLRNTFSNGYSLWYNLEDIVALPVRLLLRSSGLADLVARHQDKINLPSQPVCSIALWAKTNLMAAEYGESRMGDNYIRVRYEDLVSDPKTVMKKVCEFVGVWPENHAFMWKWIRDVTTIGRHRKYTSVDLRYVVEAGKEALTRFGYV